MAGQVADPVAAQLGLTLVAPPSEPDPVASQLGLTPVQPRPAPMEAHGVTDPASVKVTGPGVPAGLRIPGNIDLYKQPEVKNADGSTSTVDSISIGNDQGEVLIPRVTPDGRHLTSDQAVKEYEKTGRHLGIFDTPAAATTYAQQLHNDYAGGKYKAPATAHIAPETPGDRLESRLREGKQSLEQLWGWLSTSPLTGPAHDAGEQEIVKQLAEGQKMTPQAARSTAQATGFIAGAMEGAAGLVTPLNVGLGVAGKLSTILTGRITQLAQDAQWLRDAVRAGGPVPGLPASAAGADTAAQQLAETMDRLQKLEALRSSIAAGQGVVGAGFTTEGAYHAITGPTLGDRAQGVAEMAGGAAMALQGAQTAKQPLRVTEAVTDELNRRPPVNVTPTESRPPETPPPAAGEAPAQPRPAPPSAPPGSLRELPTRSATTVAVESLPTPRLAPDPVADQLGLTPVTVPTERVVEDLHAARAAGDTPAEQTAIAELTRRGESIPETGSSALPDTQVAPIDASTGGNAAVPTEKPEERASGAVGERPVGGADDLGRAVDHVTEPVRTRRLDSQILDPIVAAIPVDVVDVLGGKQAASDVLFHDPAVLIDSLSANANLDIPTTVSALRAVIAWRRAELGGSSASTGATEYLPALEALDSKLREVVEPPGSAARSPLSQEDTVSATLGTKPTLPLTRVSSEDIPAGLTNALDLHPDNLSRSREDIRATMGPSDAPEEVRRPPTRARSGQPGPQSAGSDPTGDAAAKAKRAELRKHARERQAEYQSAIASAPDDVVHELVQQATRGGYAGDEDTLRTELRHRLALISELDEEFASSGHNPHALLKAIAGYGGLSIKKESKLKAELRDLAQLGSRGTSAKGAAFGRLGGVNGVFNQHGLSLDLMLSSLQQDAKFGHLETLRDLHDAIDEAGRAPRAEAHAADRLKESLGERWWERIKPVASTSFEDDLAELRGDDEEGDTSFDTADFEPQDDVLDTGERQARLPEAGSVRDRDVKTPEFEAPFSLSGEAAETKAVEPSLFGDEKPQFAKRDERDLVIQHNLTADNIRHANKLGGIPVPALAIAKHDDALTGFGEVTLLGNKAMADPQGYARTRVFGSDVYSPRYPTIHYKVPSAGEKKLAALFKSVGDISHERYIDLDSLQKDGPKYLEGSPSVMAAFLRERGHHMPAPEKDDDAFHVHYALRKVLDNGELQQEFTDYARRLFDSLNPSEHIYRGFTNDGNRSYKPHTLENVVAILKKDIKGGESDSNIYGVGQLRARFTPQFKSVAGIKAAKDRIVTDKVFDAVKKDVEAELFAIAEDLRGYYKHGDGNRFGFVDTVMAVMEDAARKGLSFALKEYGFENVPEQVRFDISNFMAKLRTLPTEYFEAKILREVDLSEFAAAVVPDNLPDDVRTILQKRGLSLTTYKARDEADRKRVIAAVATGAGDQILFWNDGDRPALDKEQIALLKSTYAGVTSIEMPGRAKPVSVLDAGGRLTAKDLKTLTSDPDVQRVAVASLKILDEVMDYMIGDAKAGVERTGLVFDDRTYGVYVPKPGESRGPAKKASIFLNVFEAMLPNHDPYEAARTMVRTAAHEALHWHLPFDGPEFEDRLSQTLQQIGPDYFNHATRRIMEAYADVDDQARYRPALRELLSLYSESRGRQEVTPDALSRSGRRAERSPDEQNAGDKPPPDLRRGRGKVVTRAELKALAEKRSTSIAHERERAIDAGYTIQDEGLLGPAVERVAGAVKQDQQLVLSVLAPQKIGVAPIAAGKIRAHTAANDQRKARVSRSLEDDRAEMDRWSENESADFIDVMEGTKSPDTLPADRQDTAKQYRGILNQWRALLVDKDLLQSYLENYWPHEWKKKSLEGKAIQKFFGRRPAQGPESYRKHRTIPTFRQGVAFGLDPVTWNPAEMLQRKVFEMSQSVKGRDLHSDLIESGLYAYVPVGKERPEAISGWTRVPEYALGVKYGPRDEKTFGRVIVGHYYAPREVVRLIENHLSPGLWGRSALFDAYKTMGNLSTQFILGWSSFHLWLTGLESMISKSSVALEHLSRGEFAHVGKLAVQVGPQGIVRDLFRGYKAIQAFYAHDGDANDVTGMIGQIIQAGGGFGWSGIEHENAPAKFMKDIRGLLGAVQRGELGTATGKAGKAVLHGALAAFEAPTSLIMNHWVPYLKVSAFLDMAELEMTRLGPEATLDEYREVLGKAWDAVDDRFGQLRYDNLFWNNTLKQVATGGLLSVGWQVGSLRHGLGALGQGKRLVQNVKALAGGGGRGKPPGPSGLSHRGDWFGPEGDIPPAGRVVQPWLQRNAAWLFSGAVMVGILGAIYQKLQTGKDPESVKDLFYPRNGKVDANGREERDAPISYAKDYYSWFKHPVTTATHKLKPFLSMLADVVENEDFFGTEIRDEDDQAVQQVRDVLLYWLQRNSPISYGNALHRAGDGATKSELFKEWLKVQAVPFSPASAEIERSAAENYLHSLMPPMHRTKAQADHAQAVRDLRQGLSEKDPAAMKTAAAAGLSDKSRRAAITSVRLGPLASAFNRATWTQAVRAYELATPEERRILKPRLLVKFGNAMENSASIDERKQFIAQRTTALARPIAAAIQ